MPGHNAHVVDNRDAQEMYGYLEARVESLKRRVTELQKENETLQRMLASQHEREIQNHEFGTCFQSL
jgi:hypothetical protein